MRAAIRWAACLVMATAAGTTLAGDTTSQGEEQQEARPVETSAIDTSTPADANADTGAASGEPARMDQKSAMDTRAAREKASRDADEQRFLQQVWSGP